MGDFDRTRDQATANEVVRESLGLTADDLGMDRPDALADLDLGDEGGDESDGEQSRTGSESDQRQYDLGPEFEEQPKKQERVTHTEEPSVQQRPIPQSAEVQADRKGNLVNKEGKIVAYAGREARLYMDLHKTRAAVETIKTQAGAAIQEQSQKLNKAVSIGMQLADQLKTMREQGNIATQAGLTQQEHLDAVQLGARAKTDPVGVLKVILTRAATAGVDLTQLGLQPGGFDTKALLDMVRQEITSGVAPVKQRIEQESAAERAQREQQEGLSTVQAELNSFLGQNPEARAYLPVFKRIYEQPELAHMSLGEIWSRIQLNLLQKQRSPNPQVQQRRLPSGRGNPPGASRGAVSNELAPVSTSYEDIVRGVLG